MAKKQKGTALSRLMGQKLFQIRRSMGLKQLQMADMFSIHINSYSRYEAGEGIPSLSNLFRIQRRLGFSFNWFLLDRGPMNLESAAEADNAAAERREIEEKERCNREDNTEGQGVGDVDLSDSVNKDIEEMVEMMKTTPLLRYKLLLEYHQFRHDKPHLFPQEDEE